MSRGYRPTVPLWQPPKSTADAHAELGLKPPDQLVPDEQVHRLTDAQLEQELLRRKRQLEDAGAGKPHAGRDAAVNLP